MGVPKFFRYISERYPNLSELIGSAEVKCSNFSLLFEKKKNWFITSCHLVAIRRIFGGDCDEIGPETTSNGVTLTHRLYRSFYLQLPQFDNMYLDMNGIIHVCSHPDDSNVHFRMSEDQMFRDILHYIDTIFHMIKPRKLFFMAVDGVAPRAKMNQQRSRRYF